MKERAGAAIAAGDDDKIRGRIDRVPTVPDTRGQAVVLGKLSLAR